MNRWRNWLEQIDSQLRGALRDTPENRWALLLCLILILLFIFTSDQSPQWIYQGF
jgi:hypothetical protein